MIIMSASPVVPVPESTVTLWKNELLAHSDSREIAVGPVQLFFRRMYNEVWIAADRTQVERPEEHTLQWERWAFDDSKTAIALKPLMPDLQVAVRPEHVFRLVPGARINVYTRIPVWIGVYSGADASHKLMEIPTVELSKTWFGDFLSGSLSYGLSTRARRAIEQDMFQPHTIISTMNIHNASGEDLLIEKVNILVERLTIFSHEQQLWSDEMDIVFKGGDQHSEITMNGTPPKAAPSAVLITPPRKQLKKSFAERILKEIQLF